VSDYLDPDSFPFTESELRSAVAWLGSGPNGDEMIRYVVDACASVRSNNESARLARMRGSTDPEEINDATLVLPDELYAALALTGQATALRVEELLGRWRAQNREARRRVLMYESGHHPNAEPTQSVQTTLDNQEAAALADWNSLKARLTARRAH
jgi:hypothetical protein